MTACANTRNARLSCEDRGRFELTPHEILPHSAKLWLKDYPQTQKPGDELDSQHSVDAETSRQMRCCSACRPTVGLNMRGSAHALCTPLAVLPCFITRICLTWV